LVHETLDDRDLYARTSRAYGYRMAKASSVAAYQIAMTWLSGQRRTGFSRARS
jgi:hypothetical protein